MIETVQEGLEQYKEELRKYWRDFGQIIERYGAHYRSVFQISEDAENSNRMVTLVTMQKVLRLTEKEVDDICKEVGVKFRTWECERF